MDKKSKNTIILSIVALALVLITVTYAYFSARITGIESASTISLTAGTMGIVYTEGNEEVAFLNIYPKNDPWVTKTFTLTANNTTDLTMYYDLGLNVITNNFPDNYLTYDLTLVSSTNGTPIATKTNQPINGTGKIKFGKGSFTDATNDTHNYELKIYFKDSGEDQNDAQEAVFNAKIYISEPLNEPDGWRNPTAGSLLAGIKSNNSFPSAIMTIPGKENSSGGLSNAQSVPASDFTEAGDLRFASSTEDLTNNTNVTTGSYASNYGNLEGKYFEISFDPGSYYYFVTATSESATIIGPVVNEVHTEVESILGSAEDDYGTSYYYRGAVENNYVVFANMCWRIVRVDGSGNTKLVLYNYNPNNVQNPCASSQDGTTNAFARYNNAYQSKFNTNYNKNTYIGYMYSNNPDSSDFDTAHANDNDSTILTFLKNWYDEKLRSYNDMLADVIWCNDKSKVTDTTYNPWNMSSIQATGLGTDNTYYKATYRLMPTSSAAPSLVCPNTGSDGKLSKFTARDTTNGNAKLYSNNKEYKIGLLTADEITFAGGTAGAGNSSYYLYKNANNGSNWYWSLSPRVFNGMYAFVWLVSDEGHLDRGGVVSSIGVRPAVSLKSTVSMVSGGTGTSSNPFVVSA